MPDNKSADHTVGQRVLDRLKSEQISMRSHWSVLVERVGIDGIAVAMFFVAVIAVSFLLFWAQSEGIFAYGQFGPLGVRAFLEAFPYQWLVIAALAILALFFLLKHAAEDYKMPTVPIAFALLGLVLFIGTVTTVIGVSDRIVDWLSQARWLSSDLLEHRGQMEVVGIVTAVSPNKFTMNVGSDVITVSVTAQTTIPTDQVILPGDRVLVISNSAAGSTITATGVQKLRAVPMHHRVIYSDPMYEPQSS